MGGGAVRCPAGVPLLVTHRDTESTQKIVLEARVLLLPTSFLTHSLSFMVHPATAAGSFYA